MSEDPRASEVRALASEAVSAGEALLGASLERRATWLAKAFALLQDPSTHLGRRARAQIPDSAGLSPAMVDWALGAALEPLTQEALMALVESMRAPHPRARMARPGRLCALVLSGNVFTAPARGAALPLLLGWPVIAKASSRDDVFPHLLKEALAASDYELSCAFHVVTFAGDDAPRLRALFEQADVVSAYGSDRSLQNLRSELPISTPFIAHGHGLGAAFIGPEVLANFDSAKRAAEGLAFDVAAYDQRGCMSPLVAWVTRDGNVSLRVFGEQVFEALAALQKRLPRGPLNMDLAASQVSFRGVGAMRGTLLEGDGYAVCLEDSGNLRLSPGYRNLQLVGVDGVHELPQKLAPLGVHLKTLGVAGVADHEALLDTLPARVAPRVCEVGRMQTPPLEALHDGLPAWEGLVRWTEF